MDVAILLLQHGRCCLSALDILIGLLPDPCWMPSFQLPSLLLQDPPSQPVPPSRSLQVSLEECRAFASVPRTLKPISASDDSSHSRLPPTPSAQIELSLSPWCMSSMRPGVCSPWFENPLLAPRGASRSEHFGIPLLSPVTDVSLRADPLGSPKMLRPGLLLPLPLKVEVL